MVNKNSIQINKSPLKLSIASINVNSIQTNHRRYELLEFSKKYKHDLILLNETKLTNHHKIAFKRYNIYRSDRPNSKQGGGTAIMIKKEISHELISYPSSKNNVLLEYTIIKIKSTKNRNLYIISAYATNDSRSLFITELNQVFTKLNLENTKNYYVLAGDLNARPLQWGNNSSNDRGRQLIKWEKEEALFFKANILIPECPTFATGNSFLDIAIIDDRITIENNINNKLKTLDYDSDHKAITLTISINNEQFNINLDQEHKYNYKATNWSKFTQNLNNEYKIKIKNNINLTTEEIDKNISEINKAIINTIQSTVPTYKTNDSVHKYISKRIIKLQKHKSQTITQLNKTLLKKPWKTQEVSVLKRKIQELKILLRKEFNKTTDAYWANQIKQINHKDAESFFPKINRMLRTKKELTIHDMHITQNNNELINRCNINVNKAPILNNKLIITNPIEKLNVIGAFYESINSPRPLNEGSIFTDIVTEKAKETINKLKTLRINKNTQVTFSQDNKADWPKKNQDDSCNFWSQQEVYEILQKLPNKTSSGLDNIPTIILKHLPPKLNRTLTIIFNNAYNNYYFPRNWKCAKILPILKPGKNENEATSYRPISLTPTLSKVYEILINKKITKHCKKEKVIPDNQFGFKHKHSTVHALNKFMSDVNQQVSNCNMVGAALIDLEKAFDSVWINGLIYKLINKKFPEHLILTIIDMITDKTFKTWDGKYLSTETYKIQEGLQQGTVNSPILFNIFTSDFINLGQTNTNNKTFSIAFADDLIIYVADKKVQDIQSKLEKLVNMTNDCYKRWNLRINPSKCETILIRKPSNYLSRNNRESYNNFTIKTTIPGTNTIVDIPHKQEVKYLGVWIDKLIRGNSHIVIQLNKAKQAFKANRRLFYNKNLSTNAKIICYLLLIRPILTYAAPIWWNTGAALMEILRAFERSCIRICLGQYRTTESDYHEYINNKKLLNLANIPRIDNFIIKLTRGYFKKIINIDNEIIKNFKYIDTNELKTQNTMGYIPPQAFTWFDKIGVIQDQNNRPIIYHYPRHRANKKIKINIRQYLPVNLVYSTKIPDRDYYDFDRIKKNKYWWLNKARHINELKNRRKKWLDDKKKNNHNRVAINIESATNN